MITHGFSPNTRPRWTAASLLSGLLLLNPHATIQADDYAIGADLSFLKQAEDRGTVFKDNGQTKPGLRIFKDHGYNWIRLRLFHTPTRLPNNLEYTIALAKQARQLGYKFLLNYHYSDTWADPARQTKPVAWQGKSHPELVQAVFEYTRDTVAAFREAGVLPDMVQVGNEITPGMLWPDGKLPEHWDNFADLLKAGIHGVEAGRGQMARPKIMIHLDRGGDHSTTKTFFDKLNTYHVDYDVIGQSYYPWWHGSLQALRENLDFMAREYQKDIMLVEVAYCWRPTEYKTKSGPFPETPAGQKEFLEQVNRLVLSVPNNRGRGVFWWEPAVTGGLRSRGFFDDEGNALPVMGVFDELAYLRTILPNSLLNYAHLEVGSTTNIAIIEEGPNPYLGLRLYPGQTKVNNGIRAEVSVDYPFKPGDTVRYSWRFRLPKDFTSDAPQNRWWLIGQWHDQPDPHRGETWKDFPGRSPPVALGLGELNGRLALGLNYGPTTGQFKSRHIGPAYIERGKWHRIAVVIRWSTGKDGTASVYLDDRPKAALSAKGPNLNNDYQHYLKLGFYRHPDISTDNWIYLDDVEISKITEP